MCAVVASKILQVYVMSMSFWRTLFGLIPMLNGLQHILLLIKGEQVQHLSYTLVGKKTPTFNRQHQISTNIGELGVFCHLKPNSLDTESVSH